MPQWRTQQWGFCENDMLCLSQLFLFCYTMFNVLLRRSSKALIFFRSDNTTFAARAKRKSGEARAGSIEHAVTFCSEVTEYQNKSLQLEIAHYEKSPKFSLKIEEVKTINQQRITSRSSIIWKKRSWSLIGPFLSLVVLQEWCSHWWRTHTQRN